MTKTENLNHTIPKESPLGELFYQIRHNRSAAIGLSIIVFFILVAILAPLLAPMDPVAQNISLRKTPPLTGGYILGADDLGRDILSRIIYGARISMMIGVVAVGIAIIFGSLIGIISAYYGGVIDTIIMRIIDVMLAFPFIILTIIIVSILGPSLFNAMIAIGVSQIPRYARIVRASVLAEKENDYVLAERALGTSDMELMFRSILPNCLAPVSVQATLGIGSAILESAALSFLGLGAQPPTPEWGLMISDGKEFITNAWWIVTMPGLATLLAVLGFNLLGDGLRDILDPRLKD